MHQHRRPDPVDGERDRVVAADQIAHHGRLDIGAGRRFRQQHSQPAHHLLAAGVRGHALGAGFLVPARQGHPWPFFGSVGREQRCIGAFGQERAHRCLQPGVAGVADAVHDDRQPVQPGDGRALSHLEDDPGARGRHLLQPGHSPCLAHRVVREGHVVAHTHGPQVLRPLGDIECAVGKVALGPRRSGRQLGLHQEMVGRRGRGLEVEALHGADAPIGPVRQQHRRHRRAVGAETAGAVLPQRRAAAPALADAAHGVDQVPVLGAAPSVRGRLAALVALEVVLHPVGAQVGLARA